jgi:hypothetical protein
MLIIIIFKHEIVQLTCSSSSINFSHMKVKLTFNILRISDLLLDT